MAIDIQQFLCPMEKNTYYKKTYLCLDKKTITHNKYDRSKQRKYDQRGIQEAIKKEVYKAMRFL